MIPKMTVRQLHVELWLNKICSIDTVKRQLLRNGLFGRVAAKKPLLTQKHVNKRKRCCEDKASWTISQWNKVKFSDECKIELNQNMWQYVRRKSDSCYQRRNVSTTTKFHRSIMVWGPIRGDGTKVLIKSDRNVDSVEYQRILECDIPKIYNSRHIIQQDCAP